MQLGRVLWVACSVLVGGLTVAHGDVPSPVLATVAGRPVLASTVRTRLSQLSPVQREQLGSTPAGQQRALLTQFAVPELALELEAEKQGLLQEPGAAHRIEEALRDALLARMLQAARASITAADLTQRHQEYQERYAAPARIHIWRILLNSEAEAQNILKRIAGPKAIYEWSEAARSHSQDRATSMRRGELGMVFPDGRTHVPTVRVDPALYAAANQVKDGELVPNPVKEGNRFALVWRRGSLPPASYALSEVEPTLRVVLARERLTRATAELLASLRVQHKVELHSALVDVLPPAPSVNVSDFVRKPSQPSTVKTPSAPSNTPLGLR